MVKSASVQILGRNVPLWSVGLGFVVLGLIAYSPYLGAGFSGDDFIFINMLEGAIPYDPLLGFWSADVDTYEGFKLLWWAELGAAGGFLRPVASWTLTLLYGIFGRYAVPFHLTSALVHSLAAFTAFLLLRRLSGRDAPSLLAAFLFLICEDHGMTVAWIATITDVLCVLFLNLAFLCHVVARQERRRWLFVLSIPLFLLAMGSKETAAAYPLIVAAYEFFFADELSEKPNHVSLSMRFRLFFRHWWAWAIPLLVFMGYMILYRAMLPPFRSLMYLDPFSQPLEYLRMALVNLPVMFVALLTQALPSIAMMFPATLPFLAGVGIALIVLLIWALLPYRGERAVWFCLVVLVLGLLPGLATEPGERLLYFPSAYGLYVVAWLILQIPPLRRRFTPDAPNGVRILGPAWGWYLLVSALILPLILLVVYPFMWIPGLRWPEQTMLDTLPFIDERQHEHVVYLNTNSSFNTFYLPDVYRYHRGEWTDLRVLSSFNGRVRARQESERALVLKTEDAGWLGNMFARIVRFSPEFEVGDVYTTETFTATILDVTPDKKDVQEVRFEFELPLDDRSVVLIYCDGATYRTWEPSPEWELLNARLDPFGY
jgi:hypothetical protein